MGFLLDGYVRQIQQIEETFQLACKPKLYCLSAKCRMYSIDAVCKHAADSLLYVFKEDPVHLGVACCIRCVMQHCFSLVSSMLRWQLTAVLGDSFVLLPYLCASRNSVTSHPTCSPHPPSLYIKLNRRSTSGDAEVGYICLPTQRWRWGLGRYSDLSVFLCKCNTWHSEIFYLMSKNNQRCAVSTTCTLMHIESQIKRHYHQNDAVSS